MENDSGMQLRAQGGAVSNEPQIQEPYSSALLSLHA